MSLGLAALTTDGDAALSRRVGIEPLGDEGNVIHLHLACKVDMGAARLDRRLWAWGPADTSLTAMLLPAVSVAVCQHNLPLHPRSLGVDVVTMAVRGWITMWLSVVILLYQEDTLPRLPASPSRAML